MNTVFWLLVFFSCCFFEQGHAFTPQENQVSQLSQWKDKGTSIAPHPKYSSDYPPEDRLNLGVGLNHSYYMSSQNEFFSRPGVLINSSQLTLQIDYQWHGTLSGGMSVQDQLAMSENTNYLLPKEVYGGWQTTIGQLWVGRKWYLWSQADEHLRRGLFQGRFMNDKLFAETYGLTGLFVETQKNSWGHILLFASPLYVPELGPHYKIVEGQFQSPNPYFRPPSKVVEFLGKDTALRYQLEQPSTQDVINHGSVGVAYEWSYYPWFLRSSYQYKPMNQLLMGVRFYLEHTEEGSPQIQVKINPRWLYHHISAIEGGYEEKGGWNYWLSLILERPENDVLTDQWTFQRVSSSQVLTAYLAHDIHLNHWNSSQAYMSASQVWGGDQTDGGEFTARESFFERRFQFYQTFEVGLNKMNFSQSDKKWTGNTRFVFDNKQKGALWINELSYHWSEQGKVFASVELIGLMSSQQPEIDNGFLSEYRANDRARVGVSYVY